MKVTREDKSPTKVLLSVVADKTDLEPIHQHVLKHFKNVKVPGFRAGKAPGHLVEQNISQQALLDDFMEHALNELYRRAIGQEQIRPVSAPNVQLKKFVPYTNLEFEAETDILGPIKLPNYKTIKIALKKPEVTVKDIDDVLTSLQARMAERNPVDRAAKTGDELTIDFAGTDTDGQPIGGADGKDYPLVLGSKSFIPGFEEQLIGLKAGDSKQFNITLPKDYGSPGLQNKKVKFSITVHKVSELVEPKLDDDFAKKTGPFKTLKDLKADIKKQLTAEKQNQAKTQQQNEIVKKIADKTLIDLPDSLIDDENSRLEEQEKQSLIGRGQTWQEHLEAEGITEEEHRLRHRPEAAERVKVGLILNEIAQKENVQVTPEELALRIQILKGQYQDPQMQAELDKAENQHEIEARLMTEKTLQILTLNAAK
jgi:trigger factor